MSLKNNEIDIQDYYSLKLKSMWFGLKQESAAFWWLCIYLFFEYVRPQSIYTSLDIIPWTQISLIFTLLTIFTDRTIHWTKSPTNLYFILLYILILLSCFFAFNQSESWKMINIVANWFLIYFLIINIVNTEKRLFIFILLFLLVSFKMSQFGFRSFAMRGFSFASWGVTGGPGWFANSGEFGIQMTIFVPLVTAFIFSLKHNWGKLKKYFMYMLPFTGLVSIVASSSRGAQLAIIVVALWALMKTQVGFKGVLAILLVGWVLYSVLPDKQMERFEVMGQDQSSTQRLKYWDLGLEVMKDNPILGIGYRNWIDYCWHMYPDGLGKRGSCEMAHNSFVEVGSEIGVPALIIYLILIKLIFTINAKSRKASELTGNKFTRYISFGLDGGLVGFLISGFFISAFFYPFFWLQISMSVALYNVTKAYDLKKLENENKTT